VRVRGSLLSERSIEMIRVLVDKGVDVNIKNMQEETPLHIAAFHGQASALRALVQAGADLSLRPRRTRMWCSSHRSGSSQ
jgi:ankyrin repeat protein